MIYNKVSSEKSLIKYTIEVAKADWKKAIDEAFVKTKGQFSIEGFRKGKIPRNIIEKRYGISVFFEPALDIIIPKCYEELLASETDVKPIDRPDFDIEAITDTTLKLVCVITVKPEVKLGKYKKLTVTKTVAEVTDADVNQELAKVQEKNASMISVTDRAAQTGDNTIIDYSGSVGGVKFDGGTANGQPLELGAGMFIPGFEEQVVGMKIGETKNVVVKFPADYGASELADKEAVFVVKLNEIRTKSLPSLNDDFAKSFSEFETFAEYKADVRKGLEMVANDRATAQNENALLEAIADGTEVDIPECMVTDRINEMIQEFEYRLMSQGMKVDDYYKYTGTNKDILASQYKDKAEKNVKIRLIMEAIIKAENITAEEDAINEKIAKFAEQAKKSLEEFKSTMRPEHTNYIVNDLLMDKTFEFLFKNNKLV